MKLEGYKLVFVVVGLIGVLLIATPALAGVIHLPSFPGGEHFSELYLLGPDQMAKNYPFNIETGQNYSVYVGVANQMGSSVYYRVYVKFMNLTDKLPPAVTGMPSSLQPLYEYRFAVQDGESWESPLTFSVSNTSFSGNQSFIKTLTINNDLFDINKPSLWDSNTTKFSYKLLFELWIYDRQSDTISYNNRFVDLQLNLTSNSLS
jgi:hypothetical protein